MTVKRKWLPDWWVAITSLLAVLFVIFNVIYRLGFAGVGVGGADTSFGREYDGQLWKIDDEWAYRTGNSPEDVAIVKYTDGMVPFRPVCGSCTTDGSVLNLARFKKGPWVYSEYPEYDGVDVANVETAETFEVDAPKNEPGKRTDPASVPFYAQRGLTFDKELTLDAARVAKEAEPLSTINESCLTFNAAFFLLFALMILLAIPLLIRRALGRA